MTQLRPTLQRLLAEEPFVRSLARSLVAEEADDVVQQTWLRALERQPVSAVRQPRKWLARIVRNLATDMRRRELRRTDRERRAAGSERVPSSAQLLEGEEVRAAMIAAVDRLPAEQRTVVLMRYYDGLPPRRIAAELGLPVSKVWNRLHAGLATLRSLLDERTGNRRAWLLPLVPFATSPRSLPWREMLPATQAFGAIAMTMKTKVVTALAALLALTVAWIAWPSEGRPLPDPMPTVSSNDADRASGTITDTPGSAETEDALDRETVNAPPAAGTATTGSLVARVRYADEPHVAAGLTVIVHHRGDDFRVGTRRAVADADGIVRFEEVRPGAVTIRTAMRASAATSATIEAGETTECTLVLDRGITLSGVVVDGDGVPVGNALVETAMPAISGADAEPAAITAADGTFTIRQCGTLTLVGARAAHYAASQLQLIQSEPGAVEHVRIELAAIGGSIEGLVVGPDGEPIAGAVVRVGEGRTEGLRTRGSKAAPLPAQIRTDENGHFRAIGIPTGEQPLMARAGAFAPWAGSCVIPAGGTASAHIRLEAGMTCRGTVRGEDGQAISATVTAGDSNDFTVIRTESRRDGTFVLTGLPPGEVEIRARRYKFGKAAAKVHGIAGQTVECNLRLSNGIALRGRIVDPEGEPIGFVQVLRANDDTPDDPTGIAHSDRDGRFLFPDCPADQLFTLHLSAADHLPLVHGGVDPRAGELELTMLPDNAPRARIRGRLLRPDGSAGKGMTVTVWRQDPQEHIRKTIDAEDGSFTIEVAGGTWSARVEERDHPHIHAGPYDLEPGAVWDIGTLSLTSGGTLVVQANSDAKLSFQILDRSEKYVTGLFGPAPPLRSELLPPGRYLLVVRGAGVAAQIVPFTIRPDAETELEVRPRPGVRQRLVFAPATATGLPYSVPFVVRRDGKLVLRDSARKPVQGEYSHEICLLPGDYTLTSLHDELNGEVSFRIGEREGPNLRVPLR